jgi:hypothetical protein
MSPSLLTAIVSTEEKEPVELPRLTTAGVFAHYGRIKASLEMAVEACRKLPDAPPKACHEVLLEIAKQCDIAAKTAIRLREANQ